MSEQIELHDNDARLYERGMTVAHSSDGDGMPDIGTSIGLGAGRMLYLGEVPGKSGWSLCVYSQKGPTLHLGHDIDVGIATDAMEIMDILAATINGRLKESKMLDISAVGCGASTTHVVDEFNATGILCAPFEVLLFDSVQQVLDGQGKVIETIIPDPDGLVRAVAFSRVLHPQKLDGDDLTFLRSALGLKGVDLAKKIGVSSEHLSRLESGAKALQPQSEHQVRTLTVALACSATKAKDVTLGEFSKQLIGLFDDIKPCRSIDEVPLSITLQRVPTDGLWDTRLRK